MEQLLELQNHINLMKRCIDELTKRCEYIYNITNKDTYLIVTYTKLLRSLTTFHNLLTEKKDLMTTMCLIRIFADNIVTIRLIYNEDNDNSNFRYFLFLLDGFTQQKKLLLKRRENTANATLIDSSLDKINTGMEFCIDEIEKHPYMTKNPSLTHKLIKDKAWRFKEFENCDKYKNYTYSELYGKYLDNEKNVSLYFSYYSQFIHGLSISNLLENEDITFTALSYEGVNLTKLLSDFLIKYFNLKINILI